MFARVRTPSLLSDPYFGFSLLGHKMLDLVASAAAPKGALARLPLIRYSLLFTVVVAGFRYVNVQGEQVAPRGVEETSPVHTVSATASLFGSSTSESTAINTAAELAILEEYRRRVAQLSLKLNLDRPTLMAVALLQDRNLGTDESLDVEGLGMRLAAVAAKRRPVIPGDWVAAGASLFSAPASAELALQHYIRRYGLD